MKTAAATRFLFRRRGAARRELIIAVAVIVVSAAVAWYYFRAKIAAASPRETALQAKIIHSRLVAYAKDHGGKFPAGATANEAYRQLFKAQVGAGEKDFGIPGEAWHQHSPGGDGPDGKTGSAPDFAGALEPGECGFAYVGGLAEDDTSRVPLIANAFSARPGIWSTNKEERGGVFEGKVAVICRVGGSAAALEISPAATCEERFNGVLVNIFTPGFEDIDFKVLNPE